MASSRTYQLVQRRPVRTIRYSPILKLYICPLSRQKCTTAEKKDGETINTLLPDDAVSLMKTLLYCEEGTKHHYFGLLDNGKIFVYNAASTTSTLSGRWGKKILSHGDIINCIAICTVSPCETQHEYHGPVLEIEDGSEAHRVNAAFAASIEDIESEQKELPKMTFLVAGTAKGHLVLYDINGDGEIYTHFIAHKDPITRVHMDKSRSLVICMVKDESLIVVSVRHEQCLQNIALTDEETVPNAITCFFPCATAPLVLIGLKSGSFDILNLRTLSRARRSTDEDIIHHKAPITVASYFDRFEMVATASLDCTVKLWTRDKLVLLTEIPFTAPIRAMSFLGREGHLLVGEKTGCFHHQSKSI